MKRVVFLVVGVSMFLGCMGLAVNRKPEPTSMPVVDKDIEQSIQEEMQKDDLSAKIVRKGWKDEREAEFFEKDKVGD